ncbi:MAG: SprT-like domain-containing protein [Nitrospirae bacterium]|nr:SprT-like domain-containing protein [Nitrospirota bacterium]
MKILITTTDKRHRAALARYAQLIRKALLLLAHRHRFVSRLPKTLLLRPLKQKQDGIGSGNHAIAGYSGATGQYYISLNMDVIKIFGRRTLLDTLAHETAHIAEALKTGQWSHGKYFRELHHEALLCLNGRRGLRKSDT